MIDPHNSDIPKSICNIIFVRICENPEYLKMFFHRKLQQGRIIQLITKNLLKYLKRFFVQKNIFWTNMENLNSVQRFIQGAYILLTARELKFSCDHRAISNATLSDCQKSTQFESTGYDNVRHLFQLLLLTFSDTVPLVNTGTSSFLMFFVFDVYMKNIWKEPCELEYPSFSFSYEELTSIDTRELIGLKSLIERIQILICSRTLYDNFEEPLSKLSQPSLGIFTNGNFSISAFNTGRVRQVLAMYRATTNSSFFDSKLEYYEFVKRVYQWFIQISETISRILKPSHLARWVNFNLRKPNCLNGIEKRVSYLISRFRIFSTLNICFDAVKVKNLRESFYIWTMEVDSKSLQSYKWPAYLAIKKVFLDFLLGNKFEYNKIGWLVLTKEMRFLGKVEAMIHHINNFLWRWSPVLFEKYNFRLLGLETRRENSNKGYTVYRIQCLQVKMISVRDNRLRNGMVPRDTPIDGLPPSNLLHMGFPNHWLYDILSATTPSGGFGTREDKDIYMELVESCYQSSMQFMDLCLDLYAIDALEQQSRSWCRYSFYLLPLKPAKMLLNTSRSHTHTLPRSPVSG